VYAYKGERSCSLSLEITVVISHPLYRAPERGAESFAACGQRRGLLALDLGSIFKKLLHQKTFIPLRSAHVTKIDFHAFYFI
jgi:hypothetical protein